MQITYAKPVDKGVTRLMYVGDVLETSSKLNFGFFVALGVVVYLALMASPAKR